MMRKELFIFLLLCIGLKANAQTVNPGDKDKKAALDQEFVNASNVKLTNLSSTQIADLALLGKLWGFLKYHHPAIAKGNYNWDFELFRIVPKILGVKTKNERNEVLSNWITSLCTFKTIDPKAVTNAKYSPNFDWFKKIRIKQKNGRSIERH